MSQAVPGGRCLLLPSHPGRRSWIRPISIRALLASVLCLLMLVAVPAAPQNLLANPDFNLTADGWSDCDDQSTPAWLATDEAACVGSGSARAAACAEPQYGILVGQCLELPPTSGVFVAARLRAASGVVVIAVNFCPESSCGGSCEGLSLAATDDGDGQWQSLNAHKNVPPGSQSVLFVAGATSAATAVDVDSTYLGLAPLQFRDDFEGTGSNPPCRWSAVISQ